jgi:hypothetical protein
MSQLITMQGSGFLFKIPWTKTTRSVGAKIPIRRREGQCDPVTALLRHFTTNKTTPEDSLFSFISDRNSTRQHLSKKAFVNRINECLVAAGRSGVQGHSIRIGGATQFMLDGEDAKVVQVAGRT